MELYNTEWKFLNFSAIQILDEIEGGKVSDSKSAILTHLETVNFNFYDFLQFLKFEIDQNDKIKSPINCKLAVLDFHDPSK